MFSYHRFFSLLVGHVLFTVAVSGQHNIKQQFGAKYPFQNTSLPWAERVDDLISRLTVEEIILQLARGGANNNGPAPPIDRLSVGPHQWNTECLRGDVEAGNATSFPEALGLAASFNTDLLFEVARATGYEVRAKHNYNKLHNNYGDHTGISCFSPVINIHRHPLWGRNQETYGEDPFLTGEFVKKFVSGLQGDDPRYILANAGCKHFAAYCGPDNSRFYFDAKVSDRDLQMTFLPAFHECVKAGTFSIMCSYNSINGIPACANEELLTKILRQEWGFDGYVVSDEAAVEIMSSKHHYTADQEESAILSLKAGCNLDLTNHRSNEAFGHLSDALIKGNITKELLKTRLRPLLYTRFRLGEFDPDEMNPYSKLQVDSVVESKEHQELAIKAAVQSFVLLKNMIDTLPLDFSNIKTAAVVGPFANTTKFISGDYAPEPTAPFIKTVLQGISEVSNTRFASGCNNPLCTKFDPTEVETAVKDADLIVVCLGTGILIETESHDRSTIDLPGKQNEVLKTAIQQAEGKKVILLLFNAGPLNISEALSNPAIGAIVECFYPSQATGDAIVRMMSNAPGANPGGRLPATWPASLDQIPTISDYNMSAGLTYRYFKGDPLLPFGYGLSYTEFMYSDLIIVDSVIKPCDNQTVKVTVSNIGKLSGSEVIQVYIKWRNASVPVPQIQLAGFNRTEIPAGESVIVSFIVEPRVRAVFTNELVVEPGNFDVFVGGEQPEQKVKISTNILKGNITVAGSTTSLKNC